MNIQPNQTTRTKATARQGVVLIAVLVCLAVVSTIMLTVVETSLRTRRQLRNEHQVEQANWMVHAGTQVAIQKLKQQPEYAGESIDMSAALEKFKFAKVDIKIQTEDGARQFVVTAKIGNDEDALISRSYQQTISE